MVTCLILTLYFFVKPSDRIVLNFSESFINEEIGERSFFLNCLNKFESFRVMQFIFGYQIFKLPESIPLIEIPKKQDDFFKRIIKSDSLKEFDKTQKKYFPSLPEKRKIIVKEVEALNKSMEIINPLYIITTEINDKVYVSKRHHDEIVDIYNTLSQLYNSKDYPQQADLFPELLPEIYNSKLIEIFFNNIFSEPIFIHPRLLDFLKITEKKPFIEYYNASLPKKSITIIHRSQPSSSGVFSPHIRRNSEANAELKDSDDNFMSISLLHVHGLRRVNFEITCIGWEKAQLLEHYLFIFQLKSGNYTWTIKKSLSEVKKFNILLEESLKKTIHHFNNYVPKKTANFKDMDTVFLEERRKGLEKYMKEILRDKSYYDELMFRFIEYDHEKKIPFIIGKNEDPLNYSMTDDGVNQDDEEIGDNLTPIEFHSLKEDMIYGGEIKKKGYKSFNEQLSPSIKNKRKVVSDINFNNVKILFCGVKKVPIQNNNTGFRLDKRHYSMNTRMERNYLIKLEEIEPYIMPTKRIRTEIKMSRNYRELEEFHKIIKKIFENDYLPDLPEDIQEEKIVLSKENMRKWEDYFIYLLNIPMIEENQTFKEFFYLDKARNKYMYDSNQKETFKLDLS